MPKRSLPENPSLENLKKQAKRLLRAVHERDADGLALVREFHPRSDADAARLRLADAQLVVARSYGFSSWAALRHHLAAVDQFGWTPPPDATGVSADAFVRLACVDYAGWMLANAERAARMLREHPEIVRDSIHAAAAAGDVGRVRALLDEDPGRATAKGGALGWEPLLYACYSRVDEPGHSTLEVAGVLLERGADPDAGFMWQGNVPPFTALTGAFGNGENGRNNPPHPRRDPLARLLLDAGADPNDGQTLYNCHFDPDDSHLELLFAYGLGKDTRGPWYQRCGERLAAPASMLAEELWAAVKKNYLGRVKLLVEHGTPVELPSFRDGRTPCELAQRAGLREIVDYLVEHGATPAELPTDAQFAAACVAGDRDPARALLAAHPTLVDELGFVRRVELVGRAAEAGNADGVRLMAELGFELGGLPPAPAWARTAMHDAAWRGDLAMVTLLVELGADPDARDPLYHATPLGWADHNRQPHVVAYLIERAAIHDAVRCDGVERVAALLAADPAAIHELDLLGRPLACVLHPDLARLDEMLALLVAGGVDLDARDRDGKTAVELAEARGQADFAATLRRYGAG